MRHLIRIDVRASMNATPAVVRVIRRGDGSFVLDEPVRFGGVEWLGNYLDVTSEYHKPGGE